MGFRERAGVSDSVAPLGAILTSAELEGPAPMSDWSALVPREGVSGAGWPDRADEHLALLHSLGVRTIAVTLEWARLQPGPRDHDHLAVERHEQLLARMRDDFGFEVWAVLVDETLPGWFAEDEGGFADDRSRGLLWPRHVDWAGETFGHLVDGWVAQREPARRALRRAWLDVGPRSRSDRRRAAREVDAALAAEAEAWRLLRGSAPVALSMTGHLLVAADHDVKAPPERAWLDELLWGCWERALSDGVIAVAGSPRREVDVLRDAYDRLVVELRPPVRVEAPAEPEPGSGGLSPAPPWRRARVPLGEAHHAVADRARQLAGERSLVVAGSLGQVADDGAARADLAASMRAVAADVGAPLWVSSPIDGWHFEYGAGAAPGLIGRDGAVKDAARSLAP